VGIMKITLSIEIDALDITNIGIQLREFYKEQNERYKHREKDL